MLKVKRAHVTVAASVALALAAGGAIATATERGSRAPAAVPVAVAPYARAAGIVDSAGNMSRAKGISSVKRVSKGRYCVKVSASGFDVRTAVPQVSLGITKDLNVAIEVSRGLQSACGNDTKSLFVRTIRNNLVNDEPFAVTIA
ncbi:hypothetical protein [Streptomyces tsukubensis]|uniref:Carboxypeptidase regulatory-like domain-containing protein n=1 Tax=Streptomyces tsukubensis TaxID=83656 RepID=A0A1V3ZY28_9ACTN|nr:hypothetical protein [Streptomyces tsukubensis]OON71236.1 hypothetical protein B1H18_34580 [Streptomyces tsukubensis]QFR96694.1 hypothetical protein GBW32_31260 [Streptomyces tsukubensis]